MKFRVIIAAMNQLVFSIPVAILLTNIEKRQITQSQSSMKAVITEEALTCIHIVVNEIEKHHVKTAYNFE